MSLNLKDGVRADTIRDGDLVLGKVGEDEVVLTRAAGELFAVGAHCTHYHGPLAEGLVTGTTVRCPWHHACFDLRSGDAVRAPALDSIATWRVEQRGEKVFVTGKREAPPRPASPAPHLVPVSVVIVGGGAAGLSAADMLRREAYAGPVTMFSADDTAPCDRPNLSKDYLAGEAKEDWIPLRPPEFYKDQNIELVLGARVKAIAAVKRTVVLDDGKQLGFGALILAPGAEPVRLPASVDPGGVASYLRSFSDSKAIIAAAKAGTRAVVIGASFIGLEVAASLRARDVEVHVVSPDEIPLARVMGPELGRAIRELHEAHGVVFRLKQTVAKIAGRAVTLSGGDRLDADFVVAGIGVRPITDLAERAGLRVDRGILVNEYLETSSAGVFAAGDAARWLDPHSGQRRRVEHWVVAERQGQIAARNILGQRVPFDHAPFFWSQHYDVTIRYTGHVESWDRLEVSGDIRKRDCVVSFKKDGKTGAVATISRDRDNLLAEVAIEKEHAAVPLGPR